MWTMFHIFSISICVALIWSMASTIALQFLLVASIIGEKTLFPFRLTLVFPSVVGVFPLLVETNAKTNYLANLQNAFRGDECCFKKSSKFITSTRIGTIALPSLANCSSTTYMSP